jgi:hypothetical protein
MKEVLFQPVERRLETLRRAFEIEDQITLPLVQRLQAEIPLIQKALQEKLELVEENKERCKRLSDDLSEIATAEKLPVCSLHPVL